MTARRRSRFGIVSTIPPRLARAVLIVYVLAVGLAGFGHGPVWIDTATASARAQFTLPDGTVPVLCGDADGSGKSDRPLCDACRLTAAPGLPPVAGIGFPPVCGANPCTWLRDAASLPVRIVASRPRGPPTGFSPMPEAVPERSGDPCRRRPRARRIFRETIMLRNFETDPAVLPQSVFGALDLPHPAAVAVDNAAPGGRDLRLGPVREVPPRAVLHGEGDLKHGVTTIVAGCVALTKSLGDGRRQIVDLLGPGDAIGLDPGRVHDCGAETVTRVRLRTRRADPAEADDAMALYQQATRALSRQREHAFLLGRKSARERVASGLIRLQSVLGSDDAPFHCPLTRQDLGDWLGLVIETVSRTLSAFQREGLLLIQDQSRFEIRDRSGLVAAAALPACATREARPPRRGAAAPIGRAA